VSCLPKIPAETDPTYRLKTMRLLSHSALPKKNCLWNGRYRWFRTDDGDARIFRDISGFTLELQSSQFSRRPGHDMTPSITLKVFGAFARTSFDCEANGSYSEGRNSSNFRAGKYSTEFREHSRHIYEVRHLASRLVKRDA
jgi:hypothetical protein